MYNLSWPFFCIWISNCSSTLRYARGVLSRLSSVSLFLMSIFLSILLYLVFVDSISSSDTIKFHPVLLFQIVLVILEPSNFQIWFRISLSVLVKMLTGILMGFTLNPEINLGKTDILTIASVNESVNSSLLWNENLPINLCT